MTKIKSIMFANFEESRSRDRDLETRNFEKKLSFLSRKFINLLIAINLLNVERWNLSTTWVQIEIICAPSLEAPSQVIAISVAKNQQKVDNFKSAYLGYYQH